MSANYPHRSGEKLTPRVAAVRGLRGIVLAVALGWAAATGWAMPAASPGLNETGAPAFVVFGPEALGLSSAPKDLHLLPDGRVLVVSQQELAFGDGIRWETYRSQDGPTPLILGSVAVDRDGQIYTGIENGMARVELTEGARWRLAPVVALPAALAAQNTTLSSVAVYPDQWFWYGGNGAIVAWRPGGTAHQIGSAGAVDLIFPLGPEVYVSDQSSGGFFRLKAGGATERVLATDVNVSEGITTAVPYGPGEMLVGTVSAGLQRFDGKTLHPFGLPGLLNGGHRITDLCAAGDGFFAAALDTVGIVFLTGPAGSCRRSSGRSTTGSRACSTCGIRRTGCSGRS